MRPLRVALVDYEAGNLRSIARALAAVGADVTVAAGPRDEIFDAIVLPGVGAFGAAMRRLDQAGLSGWISAAASADTPLVGICLGMQVLYERSEESPEARGLGVLRGAVRRLPSSVKVPHMGWNRLQPVGSSFLTGVLDPLAHVYFVHSYVVQPADPETVVAVADHGVVFPAVVACGRVVGLQFHPEKSGPAGLRLLAGLLARLAPLPAG
ncbi:MAG TPA: imidazole glycerol phosphate synthase subunit HisH [bacterium]|nr:imidazole glycerol phosphate synthase subunit HisH [bacterium]